MDKYQYKIYTPKLKRGFTQKSLDFLAVAKELDELGQEGWELVSNIPFSGNAGVLSYGSSTTEVVFILKRKI